MKRENLLNYARKARLVLVVAPRYLAKVFGWIYKGGSMDLHEYLIKKNAIKKSPFNPYEATIIAKTDPANMDVTLLYKLFVHACDVRIMPKNNTAINECTLAQVLHQVKKIRNDVSHKDPEKLTQVYDDELVELANEMVELLERMLILAGQESKKPNRDITKLINDLKADVCKEKSREDGITVEEFIAWGRQELLEKHEIPDYEYVEPRLVVEPRDAYFNTYIPLSELLSYTFQDGSQPHIIQVMGESGAGKTSLCQTLVDWWLKKDTFTHVSIDYELVLYITCSDVTSSDLQRHLRTWTLPDTTIHCDAIILPFLSKCKILWLVDGWDEATKEARGLMKEIIQCKVKYNHTIIITCRPELSDSIANLFYKENIFNVSFAEFQEEERKKLVEGMNLPGLDKKVLEKFLGSLNKFPPEEQRDLSNPLKLQLMARLCCYDPGMVEGHHSLSLARIYHHIIQWKRNNLIERCMADCAPGQDVAQMIDKWLSRLYEVSFNSTKSEPSLILDKRSVKILSNECGVSSRLCRSTFLASVPGAQISSMNTFSHSSQRCVYAALHLTICCKNATDTESKLEELLDGDAKELDDHVNPNIRGYDIFKHILLMIRIFLARLTCGWICQEENQLSLYETVSCFVRKLMNLVKGNHLPAERWIQVSASRSRLVPVMLQMMELRDETVQAKVSSVCLVRLFSRLLEGDRDSSRWLELVRNCGDKHDVVKEVSRKIDTKVWVIKNHDVKGALMLLEYVTPTKVDVVISGDPKILSHLTELLTKLSERSVKVDLSILRDFNKLGYSDFSNKYLEIFCKRYKCSLRSFTGYLSCHGLSMLKNATDLVSLSLRVTEALTVENLAKLIPKLKLKKLKLMYDNKTFKVSPISADYYYIQMQAVQVMDKIKLKFSSFMFKDLIIHLLLPHLRDTSVNSAVNLISALSKDYMTLTVGKLDKRGLRNLIAGLKEEGVRVRHFRRFIRTKNGHRRTEAIKNYLMKL